MKTIKFTAAKTEALKQAICLLDMYRHKTSLKMIKESASAYGLEIKGRTSKVVFNALVDFYNNALNAEEAETLKITF